MCGIAGFYHKERGAASEGLLESMIMTIQHRGPDHQEWVVHGAVGMAHARLKIIDLVSGDQPIYNEAKDVVVIYNGEIYNYKELRHDLLGRGHAFKTETDTEVLVHLYEDFGIDFVSKLNGMFAFCLYDIKRGKLYLVRDRYGVKPLYYAITPSGLYFASEINALKKVPDLSMDLSPEGISCYFTHNYIPQPFSSFQMIKKLESGCFLEKEKDKPIQIKRYFQIQFSGEEMSEEDATENFLHLLNKAVKRQLAADVPIGLFLSSGLDSCALLAICVEAGLKIPTFTLSFEEPGFDEGPQAKKWADFFGVEHQNIKMAERDLWLGYEGRVQAFGEPLGGWINYGQTFISHEVRELGYKVMLSGAGGDEIICGYPTLNAAYFSQYVNRLPSFVTQTILRSFSFLGAGNGPMSTSFKVQTFLRSLHPSIERNFFNFRNLHVQCPSSELFTKGATEFLNGLDGFQMYSQYEEDIKNMSPLERLQFLDMKCFLEGSVLGGGDSATMASSIEERVPMLDNELFDFCAALPVRLKFKPLKVKYFLRSALTHLLLKKGASDLLAGYEKRGYWLPAYSWLMKDQTRKNVHSMLKEDSIYKHGFFNYSAIENILESHYSGRSNNERMIQMLIGATIFFNQNRVSLR